MYVEEGDAMIALLCLCSVILKMLRCCSINIIFVFRAVIVLSRVHACGIHVLKPFRVLPPVPVVLADLHPRFVLSCVAAHIMAAEPTRSPSKEAEISDTEEAIVPPSQSSSSASDAHNAAAAENAKQKAAKKKGNAEKRKADKVLTMPQSSSVSDLQISLQEAKSKRDAAKKEAKVETNKVKLARKRVERVKAKARVLSNNDLYEVYILRMQEEAKKNAAKK